MSHPILSVISHVSVNWMEDYGNSPRVTIYLREDLDMYDYVGSGNKVFETRTKDKAVGWFGENEHGFVSFFAHSGEDRNEGGFGGNIYTLKMKDGTEKVLKGPWSSRPGAMNALGFTPSVDVTINGGRQKYNLAGAITYDAFEAIIRQHLPHLYIFKRTKGETVWNVSAVRTHPCKPSGRGYADDREAWELVE